MIASHTTTKHKYPGDVSIKKKKETKTNNAQIGVRMFDTNGTTCAT